MKILKLNTSTKTRYIFGATRFDKDNPILNTEHILHSDTLYSAIINSAVVMGIDVDLLLGAFDGGKIRISSGLWGVSAYQKDGNGWKYKDGIILLPKPFISFPPPDKDRDNDDAIKSNKDRKRVKYLSIGIVKDMLSNIVKKDNELYTDIDFMDDGKYISIGKEVRITRGELDKIGIDESYIKELSLWKEGDRTRVSIKYTEDNDIFYEKGIYIVENIIKDIKIVPNIFVIVDGDDSIIDKYIMPVFRFLCDDGIGGDRSVGAGFFDGVSIIDDSDIKLYSNEEYIYSLSLANVDNNEARNIVYYDYINRGGYIYHGEGSGIPKKKIYMILEGSIFKAPTDGRIVSVVGSEDSNGYKAFKYGKILGMGFNIK